MKCRGCNGEARLEINARFAIGVRCGFWEDGFIGQPAGLFACPVGEGSGIDPGDNTVAVRRSIARRRRGLD